MPSEMTLAEQIRASSDSSVTVTTTLATNQRVIARVTDGIYRQPGSALRELISNAYDADATRVTIRTDAPRFEKIVVEDDGIGMSPESLAHVLKNIGGSAKRTDLGQELGMASSGDSLLSPGGRPLIGKLGIGMFSVSQLTRAFQIITKVEDDEFRTVALVKLRQFSDVSGDDADSSYEAGEVLIWRESTPDISEHGTTIVLTSIRPQTRQALQSSEIWDAVDNPLDADSLEKSISFIPRYHIGRTNGESDYRSSDSGDFTRLPWDSEDSPEVAFRKLVNCVWDTASKTDPNPKLESMFDNYLRMIWDLALALPLEYVDGNVFDEDPSGDWADFYELSNGGRGSVARKLEISAGATTVRDITGITADLESRSQFDIYVDNLKLSRPIKFRNLPASANKLKTSLLFVGKLSETFEGYPTTVSAGPLEFQAYFYWSPKIAPVDHRGVLVRIHGSSGAPFDHSFFRYQVSEQTRLRQITCEIFVTKGVEAALNIDREAYNTSHPHMVILTKWVHNALRQIATSQKKAAQIVRLEDRREVDQGRENRLDRIVALANEQATDGSGSIPDVVFAKSGAAENPVHEAPRDSAYRYRLDNLRSHGSIFESPDLASQELIRLKAIAQVLSVYGVLDSLTQSQQEALLRSIGEVLRNDRE